MTRFLVCSFAAAAAAFVLGCEQSGSGDVATSRSELDASPSAAVKQQKAVGREVAVLTSSEQLSDHIGEVVTIRGVVTNTKIATIIGVCVDSFDPDLRGQMAEATGVLERWVVTQEELDELNRGGEVASPGPGTYHVLSSLDGTGLAKVQPASD